MHLQSLTFRSTLPPARLDKARRGLAVELAQVSGLSEALFVTDTGTGEIGVILAWRDAGALRAFETGPSYVPVSSALGAMEAPEVELLDVSNFLEGPEGALRGNAIGSVRFRSGHTVEKLQELSAATMGDYAEMPGLCRVYRVAEARTGRVGGVYVWAGEEYREANLGSATVAKIPEAYAVEGEVEIRRLRIDSAMSDY
ncbi:hypothetical protein [Tomitella fengzijianii]|uniref:hypothetical protein n=1 Tax=Tomitella fengzijianii TaxID=2597660 RepID=UPI00131BB8A0|nr:hypothetical protein [Tomitella fengzijianii]